MLHALPFTTFGEIAVLGLEVEIRCPSCCRVTKIDPADERLRDRPFTVTRFVCTGLRDFGFAHPKRPCDSLGHIHVRPPDAVRRLAQKETVHPVFDPALGSGEVRRLLSLLPRNAKGPHYIVKHDPLHRPIARNGLQLSDQPACEPLSCRGLLA